MKRVQRRASVVAVVAVFAFCFALAPVAAVAADKALERAARALRGGEFEEAEKLYREVVARRPLDTQARLGLSYALLKQRKNQEAYDAAARVIATEPLSARAHALLGSALLASGEFRVSVEEFRTALSFKDDEALAVAGLAMVDFYENRLAQSYDALHRATFLDPDEPDFHYFFGQVAARRERYAEAADSYERFLRIAPRTDVDRRARIRGLIDFLRYLGTQRQLLRTAGAERTLIPFEIVSNRPVLQVRVNGEKEPFKFVLDTGAGMCVLSSRAAARLGMRPVARGGMARGVGGVGKFEIVYGFVQSLQMGEARVENVPVYIREFHNTMEAVDGYIGLSVFSKFHSSVDFGARGITLLRGDERPTAVESAAAPPAPGSFEVPIRTTPSGYWSGEVQLDGVPGTLNFIIDTGATVSVVSEKLAEREDLERFSQSSRIKVFGAAGVAENVKMLVLPRVVLGGAHARRNVRAAVLDLDSINETSGFEQTGIIGGNILSHFRVIFDFQRAVVRLEPIVGKSNDAGDVVVSPVIANEP